MKTKYFSIIILYILFTNSIVSQEVSDSIKCDSITITKSVLFKIRYGDIKLLPINSAIIINENTKGEIAIGQEGNNVIYIFDSTGKFLRSYYLGKFLIKKFSFNMFDKLITVEQDENYIFKLGNSIDTIPYVKPELFYLTLNWKNYSFLNERYVPTFYYDRKFAQYSHTKFDYIYNFYLDNQNQKIYQVLDNIVVGLDELFKVRKNEIFFVTKTNTITSKIIDISIDNNYIIYFNDRKLYFENLKTNNLKIISSYNTVDRYYPYYSSKVSNNYFLGIYDNGLEIIIEKYKILPTAREGLQPSRQQE